MGRFEQFQQIDTHEVPSTMKAVVVNGTGFDKVHCCEVPVPTPGANQLLCRVDAAGVCTSIIKLLEQGPAHTFINGWDLEKFPIILGDEGAVTVVKVGDNLKDQYRLGERFAIQPAVDVAPINHRERYTNNAKGMNKCAVGYTLGGNLAQYILIQEEVLRGECLLPLPKDDMPYFAVSMAEPISCICSAQDRQIHIHKAGPFAKREPRLGLLAGGTTVVIGAGAMGLMHAEMAMRFAPKNLIIADILPDRLEKAKTILTEKATRLGVNLITVHSDALRTALDEASGQEGADDIILAVGIQQVQQDALTLLGKGGVANLFGGLPRGKHMLQTDAIAVHYNEIKLVGSSGGEPSDLVDALNAIATGDIDPGNFVYGIGSLKHVPRVLEMIRDRQVDGKVIVYPHAEIEELTPVEHWSLEDERKYLDERLS